MLLCLLLPWLSLACAQEPGPKQALTLARAELEQRGADTADLQPCPEADLGPHRCYRAGGLFVFVGPSGALRADGSGDWYTALSGADPLQVAAALQRLGSAEKLQLQSPSGRKPSQVSAQAWARVSAPKIEELPGALVFTAWYASPPAFGPWQLRLEARPGTPARVSTVRVEATLSPSSQADAMLNTLLTSKGTAQKATAEWLGQNKEPRAVPGLVAMLGSKWNDGRRAAALALGQIANPSAVAPLLSAALVEADPYVVAEMVRALAAIGGPEARAALDTLAAQHPDSTTRAQAQSAASGLR